MRAQYSATFQCVCLVLLSIALSVAVNGSPTLAIAGSHNVVADTQVIAQDRSGNGLVWSDPVPLNNNAAADSGWDEDPQVATDRAGHWVAVWHSLDDLGGTIGTDWDILVAHSTDNGFSWTDPAPLNNNAASDSEGDSYPQVATDGAGNWVAVWFSSEDLGGTIGTDYDILTARSADNGATWTDPAPLNNNAGADSRMDRDPWVAADPTGNWVAVWCSYDDLGGTIGTDPDILVARSADNGTTWTDPEPLNNNAATDSGSDAHPHVTTDGAGHWVAVWDSYDSLDGSIGTDLDILVARSADNGATWTGPEPLNNNAATDPGYDWYPNVTTDGTGQWLAVWHSSGDLGGTIGTDYDILVARSTDHGLTWTDPAPLNNNAPTDSGSDAHACATTDSGGHFVTVWRSYNSLDGTIGTDGDILVALSADHGTTWTDPEPLNNNAATDSGADAYPQVTTDSEGHWVAVWCTYDDLDGTIGDDSDILVARSIYPGCTCGDMNRSGGNVDLADFGLFALCYGYSGPTGDCTADYFVCSDLNGDGRVDLQDFGLFALWYGQESSQTVPNCAPK